MCVFHQQSYINLLKLLITSISDKGKLNILSTDILIITSQQFQPLIKKELSHFILPIHYYILDLNTLFEAGCARLNIFKYENIDLYDKILYIDTDILINSDVNILFNLEICPDKIYALEEGNIGNELWGGQFFDFSKYDKNQLAFTSGILYFHNSIEIKQLFLDIVNHIDIYIYKNKNPIPVCLDQPFIVYNAITKNKYDNQLLKLYVENNPKSVHNNIIIYHFPGGPGSYASKYEKMTSFWKLMNVNNNDNSILVENLNNITNTFVNNNNTTNTFVNNNMTNTFVNNNMTNTFVNNKYFWEEDNITFLENGKMNAFGIGTYIILDTYKIEAKFGGREHTITFNNDYTTFESIRTGDKQIVKGKYVNLNNNNQILNNSNNNITNITNITNVKIIQYGTDGFGHQLEGTLRLISHSLNNKADYQYDYKKKYIFEHSNFDIIKLEKYLDDALNILQCKQNKNLQNNNSLDKIVAKDFNNYTIIKNRTYDNIIKNDINFQNNIYLYDGVGCGSQLPPNFEIKGDLEKSLPILRESYVEKNENLPKPTYYNNKLINVCCHIRLGDAVGTRILDNDRIYKVINYFQNIKSKNEYCITIHSNGNINNLKSNNTIIHDSKVDVLQILSDFINADILIINYSALSIAAHLLADTNQKVICPNNAGPTFKHRILSKCITCDEFLKI